MPITYQFAMDDDDADLDGASTTRAIVLPPLAPRVNLNITRKMIQLFNLKRFFGGLPGDDSKMHLVNFVNICKYIDYPGVGKNTTHLRLFYLSLYREATLWMIEIAPDSITN